MGIQINGTTDSITAIDGSLSLSGAELATVSGVNVSGVVTATSYIVSAGSTSAPSISPSGDSNTGIFFPSADTIAFGEGGSEVARFDSSGRLGIGTVSPASGVTLHVNASGGGIVRVSRLSASASAYGQLEHDGTNSTLSSTAATIFVTNSSERARIDSSGNLLVGATSAPGGYSGNIILGTSGGGFYFNGSSAGTFGTSSNQAMVLATNAAERARIDSSGRLLVGTSTARGDFFNTSNRGPSFQVEGTTTNTSGVSVTANLNNDNGPEFNFGKSRGTNTGSSTIVSNGDGLGRISFQGADGSELVPAAYIEATVDGTPGSNDMPGRLTFSTTADGASSPTERMRITQQGNVMIGKTTSPGSASVVGADFGADGYGIFTRTADASLYINRLTNDGTLVSFRQDNTEEGTISVSGTTVQLNGAHLSRWSQLLNGGRQDILRGTVLSNLDEMCEWGDEDNEQLNRMQVSDVEGDPNVAGVFVDWDNDDDTYTDDFYCAMTGDFIIRIAEGVTVQRGQLLMSAGDGTAKPQGDGFVQDKTIAKVTSTHVTCTYEDGSYCVPCVLMAC